MGIDGDGIEPNDRQICMPSQTTLNSRAAWLMQLGALDSLEVEYIGMYLLHLRHMAFFPATVTPMQSLRIESTLPSLQCIQRFTEYPISLERIEKPEK